MKRLHLKRKATYTLQHPLDSSSPIPTKTVRLSAPDSAAQGTPQRPDKQPVVSLSFKPSGSPPPEFISALLPAYSLEYLNKLERQLQQETEEHKRLIPSGSSDWRPPIASAPVPVRRSARLGLWLRGVCPRGCATGASPGSSPTTTPSHRKSLGSATTPDDSMSRTGLPVTRADSTSLAYNKENLYASIRRKVKKCLTRGSLDSNKSEPRNMMMVDVVNDSNNVMAPPVVPLRMRTVSGTSSVSSGISVGKHSVCSNCSKCSSFRSASSGGSCVGRQSLSSSCAPRMLEDSGRASVETAMRQSGDYGSRMSLGHQSNYSARIAACLQMSAVTNKEDTYASIHKPEDEYNHQILEYTSNTYPAYDPIEAKYPSRKPSIDDNGRNRLSCISGKSSVDFSSRPLPPIPKPLGLSSKANIPTPLAPPPEGNVELVRTIRLDRAMHSQWVSGLAVTRKNELVVVDLRDAFLLDHNGNVKRNIGARGPHRLFEPIDVTVLPSGNIAFSDHAERDVKVFTSRGQFVRLVSAPCQTNIAGVAATDRGELIIAGTDRKVLTVHAGDDGRLLRSLPGAGNNRHLEHPYSVAVNPLTGDILVGDDSKQLLTAMSPDGRILWRFCPSGDRHFFPSSVCVDDVGYVFVADLYNEKVYMLDSSGKYLKTLLSRGRGLKGGPGALAVDKRGHLYVADEERTIKVFKYGENGFALYRRFKTVPENDL